jgi:hypothetical protein
MWLENNPKTRENDIVVQDLKGELLIYDQNSNKAFCLNPTSAAVWNLCDGTSSVSDITKQLSIQLKQPVTDELVWLAIDQFKTDNLLSESYQIGDTFGGLSRREVIKKVGFASMIALPVISSLVVPTAAMAQSGVALRAICQTCTTTADCASGRCLPNALGGSNLCAVNSGNNTYALGTGFGASDGQCTGTVGPSFCCSGRASRASGACRCE